MTEVLEAGKGFLEKHNIEEPRRNAEILLAFALKKPLYYLYTRKEEIPASLITSYFKILGRRASHIPLQYITGEVDFYKDVFFVKKGVFIPRPETEILVEKTIALYKKYLEPEYVRVLDIGTGCGNIAVSLAKEIKHCSIVATDISKRALDVSILNALRHKVKNRIRFVRGDIFPPGNGKFQIIVSNPPYVSPDDIALLDENVKREPLKALYGGKDGTSIIKKILHHAGRFLYNRGFVLIEIGHNQADFIRNFRCNLKLISIEKDLAGIERVAVFQKCKS